MLLKYRIYLFAFVAGMALHYNAYSRVTFRLDSLVNITDSLAVQPDSLAADSANRKKLNISSDLKSKISYSAKDSTPYSADLKKIYQSI